jgi:hypothetical protein
LSPRYEAGKYAVVAPSDSAIESTASTIGVSETSAILSLNDDSGCVPFNDANDADEEDNSDEDHISGKKQAPSHTAAICRTNEEDDANDADEEDNSDEDGLPENSHARLYSAAIGRMNNGAQTLTTAHPAGDMSDSESSDSDSDLDYDEDDDEDEEDKPEIEPKEDTSFIVFG